MNDIIDILALTLEEDLNAKITQNGNIFTIQLIDGKKFKVVVEENIADNSNNNSKHNIYNKKTQY